MSFIVVMLGLMVLFDVVWWLRADAWARRRGSRTRALVAAWAVLQTGVLFVFFVGRLTSPPLDAYVPRPLLAAVFIWHLLVLPTTMIVMSVEVLIRGAVGALRAVIRDVKRRFVESNSANDTDDILNSGTGPVAHGNASQPKTPLPKDAREEGAGEDSRALVLSRRSLLGASLAGVPPLVTVLTTGRALATLDDFRVRRIDVTLPNLPRDLDGLSIAQVTDVHVGRFTTATILPKIALATNRLRADLVLMTGDLINMSLEDLPAGLEMVKQIDPRRGLYTVEGNHDLIADPSRFEHEVKSAGVPLLLDDVAPLEIRGRPVDLLGLRWARGRDGYSPASLARVWAARRPDAFPILLAHHPHAFDEAAALGVPLTLSGHTHGGQLHLSDRVGFGPLMFRYWSGLYRKPQRNDAALVVSNGVGNWFPLRVNVPAEIVHVVLHHA